ncbi:MAG: cupin domain-containing protein [Acidobacteriota bacterium]|nr:cupin domain-containing protein [Acidobacteriota bacterium]
MTQQTIDLQSGSASGTVSLERARPGNPEETATASLPGEVKYVPAGSGADYWGPGTVMTFLITGKDTGGAFFMAEMSVPPGGGPPPHIHHREDESFYLLEGALTVQVGGKTLTASAGAAAFLPRGIVHSFKNTGDANARALLVITPAGLEHYFTEVFDPVRDRTAAPPLPSKEFLARALAASPRYGLELLPPA